MLSERRATPHSGLRLQRTWRHLGGNEESPQERVAWNRARLQSHLASAEVASIDRLFDVRRSREGVHLRRGVRGA